MKDHNRPHPAANPGRGGAKPARHQPSSRSRHGASRHSGESGAKPARHQPSSRAAQPGKTASRFSHPSRPSHPSAPAGTGGGERHAAARLRALEELFAHVIRTVLGERKPLDRVLSEVWRNHHEFGSRDRRFFGETIFGAFRCWGELRLLLSPAARAELDAGHVDALSGAERARLLLGAWHYQHAPRYAEADLLAARVGPQTFPKADPAALIPEWVRELPLPPVAKAYLEHLAVRPPMWLRVQGAAPETVAAELQALGLKVEQFAAIPEALAVLEGAVNLFTVPAYRNGYFEVQDLASQLIVRIAAPRPKERWWDPCAGAGGKSLALAEAMQRRGTVVAGDVRAYKLDDLRKRARRAGFPNIIVQEWDGKAPRQRKQGTFDGVLLDAPCSCSGVWRRNPDGPWTTNPAEIAEMSALQRRLLDRTAPAVTPGGVLIYATCSAFPAENEEVAAAFLATHPEFTAEPFPDPVTGKMVESGTYRSDAAMLDCDAMFAARFRRKSEV